MHQVKGSDLRSLSELLLPGLDPLPRRVERSKAAGTEWRSWKSSNPFLVIE